MQEAKPPSSSTNSTEMLKGMDAELVAAAEEVDRTLIQLALERTPFERLRAGIAMARFASRFGRGAS